MNVNNYFAEFLGTTFYIYVILATGNPLAIGAALALAMLLITLVFSANLMMEQLLKLTMWLEH